MGTQYFMVLTDPVEGQDAAYNDWYDNQHLADVLAVDGFVSAQRFSLSHQKGPEGALVSKFLAIYEMETDDVDATLATLLARLGTSVMPVTPALDDRNLGMFVATALAAPRRRA
ncbi:MAG TPA: hypothetical protein VGV37_23200 [Aliidongia sp.]|uniref:hypothetical protein n=1 Tax=Aliidongia sp. TaxID=1914230 RepID=UPI002DDD36DE|nr:hypothetical protein [Aliidongia sp.]HEV2677456.1 hypothetical protein [Aliidongia sp.]